MAIRKSIETSRRKFIKNIASAAVGTVVLPNIIPSSAIGATPPSDRIVMGIIGMGGQGRVNIHEFMRLKQWEGKLQFVALCDLDKGHLERGKGIIDTFHKNKDCRTYEEYREFYEKEKLDAVSIAVPDHWHSFTYIEAANHKVSMYGEKPLARSIGESKAILNAVKRNGVTFQTGSWQRSRDNFLQACELVRNGRIGKITYTEVGLPNGTRLIGTPPVQEVPEGLNWELWLGSAPRVPYRGTCHANWRWILDYSGGQLTDWAGHHIDIAQWGLGIDRTGPVEISGTGVYPREGLYDVPVEYDFTCKFANGLTMRVANEARLPLGAGATWYGEKGWIRVDRGRLLSSDPKILEEKMGAGDTRLYASDNHWNNFLECVRDKKETIAPVEVAHRAISVALLGEIAMQTGEVIKWDPDKEEIIGNERASRMLTRPLRAPWKLPTA